MSGIENTNSAYKIWIRELKNKIRSVQIKAAIAVNLALIEFYWELGKNISEKQTPFGTKFLEHLSKDLQNEFPEMKGLSLSNLKYAKRFYNFYTDSTISQQLVDQLPWGHNILIFTKSTTVQSEHFYLQQTIQNN